MCGRYTFTYPDLGEVAELLGAEIDASAAEVALPRFNVAPSQTCVIGRSGDDAPVLTAATWGLRLGGGRFVINVRHEASGRHQGLRRCVVPADGFYEWIGEKGDRRPVWFHRPEGGLLLFAGLLDERKEGAPSFAVLTGPAREPVRAIHARMPIVLDAEHTRGWLDAGRLSRTPLELEATPVSPRVNSAVNDDASLLEPAAGESE